MCLFSMSTWTSSMGVLGGLGWPMALGSIPPSFVTQLSIFRFFIFFYELHHLLVEVNLVPHLGVHQGLQDLIW